MLVMNAQLKLVSLAIVAAIGCSASADTLTSEDLSTYHKCVVAATNEARTADEIIKACTESAEAGIPGAQYALGVGLLSRGQAGDRTRGLQWLEKTSATGHPAAALVLGSLLAQEESPASVERGRGFLQKAVCSGYPPAVSAFAQHGVSPDKLGCVRSADEDFSGEWLADLKWVKIEPFQAGGPQLKMVFEGNNVRVFMKSDSDWSEVKAGKFNVTHLEQSISVSALDSDWDFDGKWIESWTIQILRTGADEARVSFLRTVNNPHVPPELTFRTFSTLAEGKAKRSPR
jgi:hypothetical protein